MTVKLFISPCLILSVIRLTLCDVYVYNDLNKLVEDYDDQPGNFGPSFPYAGMKGYVMLTKPKNACSQVAPPPKIPISGYNWIALIPRTKSDDMCDFDLKVLNAQNANFSAVIIYNYEDALVSMGAHGRTIKIPSTLITLSDGLSIISAYLYNETVMNSTHRFHLKLVTEQLFQFGAYLIPLLCVVGVSFLGLICFILVKCYLHRRRANRHRLPRSALKQLKTKKFVKGDRWEVCAICLDDYEDGAKLRILPCDHAYHMKCIDPWLLNNRRQCPVCKRYVFPNHDNSDEEESNTPAATERTPLIRPSDDTTDSISSRNHPFDRRVTNASNTGVSDFMIGIHQSSDTDNDDDDGERSSASRQPLLNRITTNDLVFDRSSSNSRRYPHPQLPRVTLRQSSADENDNNTTTTYGSVHDSPSTSFTTPRAANFFVGSLGGTTDNTNMSAHSAIEDISGIETDDNDERMHSVLTDVEINEAYVPDQETTDTLHTNL